MGAHRLAQRRDPGQRRVLVLAAAQRRHRRLDHLGGPVGVGEALPEVDRAGAQGERRHLGEDGGAQPGGAGGGPVL